MSEILTITKPALLLLIGGTNHTVLDIGSFDGVDALEFCKLGCKVDAFEPLPENVAKIKPHPNLTVHNVAVGSINSEVPMHVTDNGCSGSLLAPKNHLKIWPRVAFIGQQQVRCITLDSWYSGQKIDLIWADVNGSESDFITGAFETLKNTRYLFIESSEKELYAGQITPKELQLMLPGWELIGVYNDYERFCDLLLKNESYI